MHPTRALLVAVALLASLAAALLLASCANPQATLQNIAYGNPAKPYLGMSKAEIVACAGQPHSTYKSGAQAETLTYQYSGAGPQPAAPGASPKSDDKKKEGLFGDSKKKDKDKDWTCTASLVFENDRLARVSFAHKDTRSPYEWQKEKNLKKAEEMRKEGVPTCSFSLPGCQH
jgi:hypothetical protein